MMTLRHVILLVLTVTTVAACRRKEPPVEGPGAPIPAANGSDAAARARADSIAAAERARREAEERERASGIARVREALSDVVYFDYDSNQLTTEAEGKLRTKAAILRANPALEIRVDGHADERGSTEYNLALSQRRAETVRDFLSGYGIAATRISTIPYGEERPRAEGTGESIWAQNRRAEFSITGGQVTVVPPEVR
jgi:peptidoglycan-associated lipoprotein